MEEARISFQAAWIALFASRGLTAPTGVPLYSYRLSTAEYNGVGQLLRRSGRRALRDPFGAALLVMFIAEWFRRERDGGGWDWIKPLAALRIRYHATSSGVDIRYPELRDAVEAGLRRWRRPVPPRRSLLTTVVSECGFPASDLAAGRLSAWLRHAVLAAEAGANAYDAVGAEDWRGADTLVQALFASAVTLCDAIVGLRRRLREADLVPSVAALDALEPDWRGRLPFDVSDAAFVSLVEGLVAARRGDTPALAVERRYVRTAQGWTARAELRLEGTLDARQAHSGLLDALKDYGRVRLHPRGEGVPWANPIATLERDESEADGEVQWRVRALTRGFDPAVALSCSLRLAALAGEEEIAEFTPFGGEGLRAPVIALRLGDSDAPQDACELVVIGEGSVRTTHDWLVLALTPEAEATLRIEGRRHDFPDATSDGRRLVGFSGAARVAAEGTVLRWRTSSDREEAERLVLVGPLLRRVRDAPFLGPPAAWCVSDGAISSIRPTDLVWKPVGRGDWRPLAAGPPKGSVYFGLRRAGEVVCLVRAGVVPAGFGLDFDRRQHRIAVSGAGGARIDATARGQPLPKTLLPTGAEIAAVGLLPGARITLRLGWETTLEVILDDPFARPMLLEADDRPSAARRRLTIAQLPGLRLAAPMGETVRFEGRAAGAAVHASRRVTGAVPLEAYEDVIEGLLGSFDDPEATVRLRWGSDGDWFAEIARWDADEPLRRPVASNSPFAALTATRTVRRTAFSLNAPSVPSLADLTEPSPDALAERLRRDQAPGPWLLTGVREADGAVVKPRELDDGLSASAAMIAVVRKLAVTLDGPLANEAMDAAAAEDLRWLVDLCRRARETGAPYACVEPLRELARRPNLTPFVLAACNNPEERRAVLHLQVALPFLWCLTPITSWRRAFDSRWRDLAGELGRLEISDPSAVAAASIVRALAEIVEPLPILDMQVRACIAGLYGPLGATPLPYALTRPMPPTDADLVIRRLLTRNEDDDPAPALGLAARFPDLARRWVGLDPRVLDVLVAPQAAALIAAERQAFDSTLAAAVRRAWLWDRDVFEPTFYTALVAEAQAPSVQETR